MSDINLTPVKNAHENRRKRRKGANGYLGAFVDGAYTTTVSTDPSLTYVRYFNGQVTTAKHKHRINLGSDNQRIAIEIGKERGVLSILDFDRDQAGAILEGDPGAGVPDHTHDGSAIVSGTVAAARLGVMTGDSGSGGAKGAVPAPVTGDATKFLKGDGTWDTPSGGGGGGNTVFVQTAYASLGNSGAEQSLIGTGEGSLTLPIAWWEAGRLLETELMGVLFTKASGAGDATINFKIAGTTLVTLTFTLTDNLAGAAWRFLFRVSCIAVDDPTPDDVHLTFAFGDVTADNGDLTQFHTLFFDASENFPDGSATMLVDVTWTWVSPDASNEIDTYQAFVRFADPA